MKIDFYIHLYGLIEDFIYIRKKAVESGKNRSKTSRKAVYEATTKVRKEKVNLKFEYTANSLETLTTSKDFEEKVKKIIQDLKDIKQTQIYKELDSSRIILVKPPLKMTNVLLKNVNYQYAVKLWNYLNDNFDLKNKVLNQKMNKDENGYYKKLIDEDFFLKYMVFARLGEKEDKRVSKTMTLTKEEKAQITDSLLQQIFVTNPDLPEEELRKMMSRKYVQYKKSIEASDKPIKDKFKKEITDYVTKFEKMRLK